MCKKFTLDAFAAVSMTLAAQNPVQPDSLTKESNPRELDDFVIVASPVIHKADRDVYSPSSEARKISNNGLSLLQNMIIPQGSFQNCYKTRSGSSRKTRRQRTSDDIYAIKIKKFKQFLSLNNFLIIYPWFCLTVL